MFDLALRLAVTYRKVAKSRKEAQKTHVVDALVLAFSHSEMREIVGTDALRSVVSVEYNDLVESGSFDLEQVWELLEQQPGFVADAAKPPMCLFKSWEEKLGIDIILPEELASLGAKERALLANACKVPPAQAARLFADRGERPARAPAARSAAAPRRTPRRTGLGAAALVVALAAFGFAGLSAFRACGQPEWHALGDSEFAGDLPIANAERIGSQVGATLTDPGWLSLPEETRRAQLEAALQRLQERQIDVLFLRDADGQICASAQLYDDGRRIRVRFP